MNKYVELKERQQKEFNDFPMFFAFSNEQFDEGMKKLGLDPNNTDKICSLGMGGFYKREDKNKLEKMLIKHEKERQEAIKSDITGDGYIYDMFYYELCNHEYGYTYELSDTLEALGMSIKEIRQDKALSNGLDKAIKRIKAA